MKDIEEIKINEVVKLDIKRFYLPINVERKCPKCGKLCKWNPIDDYLTAPVLNRKFSLPFYCYDCDDYFEVDLIIHLSISVGTETHEV